MTTATTKTVREIANAVWKDAGFATRGTWTDKAESNMFYLGKDRRMAWAFAKGVDVIAAAATLRDALRARGFTNSVTSSMRGYVRINAVIE